MQPGKTPPVPPGPPFGDYSGGIAPGENVILKFRNLMYEYFGANGRAFPWRETDDPYRILVSEIMLQQTQVERVRNKYIAFVERWPNIQSLSQASLKDVYSLWSGLGYNRRAKALLEISKIVVSEYKSQLPKTIEKLIKMPMLGHATAASICAFAFNKPVVFLETNIRRVLIYFFFEGRKDIYDRELLPVAASVLDASDPRNWYYALMDYGFFLKRNLPNPNIKSKHYYRQSPFENSDRQIRGQILKVLDTHGQIKKTQMTDLLNFSTSRVYNCLDRLEQEGLITAETGIYRIAD